MSCLNSKDLVVECKSSCDELGVRVYVLPLINEFKVVRVFNNLSY